MPQIQPDFSEVLEQLPEGNYKAHIVDAEVKTSQAGNPYVRWQMTVYDAEDPRCNGKAVWTSTMTSGKGAGRLKQLYKAATGKALEGPFNTEDLYGKAVTIVVVNGTDRDGSPSGFMDVKAVKALAA